MDQLEVKILERVFKLQVPEAEKPRLMEAVRLVDAKMREISDTVIMYSTMISSAGPTEAMNSWPIDASVSSANTTRGPEPGGTNAPSVPPQVSSKITQMSEELEVEIRRQENLF